MELLTENQILANLHIPISVIEKDIRDTQKEIDQYRSELHPLLNNRQENKLKIYFTEGKINQREVFVNKLSQILKYKKSNQ